MIHKEIEPRLVQRFSRLNSHFSTNPFNSSDKESQNKLKDIVSFDYMGAAEFEYGGVNECLNDMRNSKHIRLTSFGVDGNIIEINKPYSIYVISLKVIEDSDSSDWDEYFDIDTINEAIINIYVKGYERWVNDKKYYVTKNDSGSFFQSLNPHIFPKKENIGWLDIDNRFAWFIDKEIAQNFYINLVPDTKEVWSDKYLNSSSKEEIYLDCDTYVDRDGNAV